MYSNMLLGFSQQSCRQDKNFMGQTCTVYEQNLTCGNSYYSWKFRVGERTFKGKTFLAVKISWFTLVAKFCIFCGDLISDFRVENKTFFFLQGFIFAVENLIFSLIGCPFPEYLIGEKQVGENFHQGKISSGKNLVTSEKLVTFPRVIFQIRHFSPTNFWN